MSLDGLRGLAALAIVALHTWMFDYGDSGHPPKSIDDLMMGELRLGVPLFFVLSGFLLHRTFVNAALTGRRTPSLRRYARNRAARILPAYWLAIFGAFTVLRWVDYPRSVSADELPLFLAFAQNHFASISRDLNPPTWTLAVEVSFYVLLAVIALIVRHVGPRPGWQVGLCASLTVSGAGLAAVGSVLQWPPTVTDSLVTYLPYFAAGMTAAAWLSSRQAPLSRCRAKALAVGGAALVCADGAWHALAFGPYTVRAAVGDVPAAVGFAVVIAALASGVLRARALTILPVRWLGTLSYGLYLWHYPVIVALRMRGQWSPNFAEALAATLALSLGAALVSWILVERPILAWAQRRDTAHKARLRSSRRPQLAYETRV